MKFKIEEAVELENTELRVRLKLGDNGKLLLQGRVGSTFRGWNWIVIARVEENGNVTIGEHVKELGLRR